MPNSDEYAAESGGPEIPGNRSLEERANTASAPAVNRRQLVLTPGLVSCFVRSITAGMTKPLVWAALLNALLFAAFFTVAAPSYETNDDLAMQLIASGFHTGEPSEYLVFTHAAIGWLLRILYSLGIGWNWYFIYLVAVHYVALTAIGFVVMSRRGGWLSSLLYVVFFLTAEIRILLSLQFTTTAFLAGAAGALLWMDAMQLGRALSWPRIIAGGALITLMIMIRENVALFLALIAFPFLAERFAFGRIAWRRLAGLGLAGVGLFAATQGTNRWYYHQDPAWSDFRDYNTLRGQIHGTPLARFISKAAPTVGWSENDARMFTDFYYPESDVYADTSQMRRLVKTLKGFAETKPIFSSFSPQWLNLPKMLDRDSGMLLKLALLGGIGCVFAAGSNRWRCLFTLATMYSVFMLVALYLEETARLPPRVAYNMPWFMQLACLYWAVGFIKPHAEHQDKAASRNTSLSVLRRYSALAWVVLYACFMFPISERLWYKNARQQGLKQISPGAFDPIKRLLPAGVKPILIPLPYDSILELCLVYRHSAATAPFYLVPYGWLTHSPLFRQILNQHGIEDFSLSVVGREDVFFLMETRWLELLRTFYREHYGLDIRFEMVLSADDLTRYRDRRHNLYRIHARPIEPTNAHPLAWVSSTSLDTHLKNQRGHRLRPSSSSLVLDLRPVFEHEDEERGGGRIDASFPKHALYTPTNVGSQHEESAHGQRASDPPHVGGYGAANQAGLAPFDQAMLPLTQYAKF